jgi:hypothetical protein
MRASVTPSTSTPMRVEPAASGPADVERRATLWPLITIGALAATALVASSGFLWAHYGTAVFFETIRAGFIACFG